MAIFVLGEVGAAVRERGAAFVETVGIVDAGAGSLARKDACQRTSRGVGKGSFIRFRYPS